MGVYPHGSQRPLVLPADVLSVLRIRTWQSDILPNTWENDWGERLPNWVEFGRLYYAYSGDMGPLNIAKGLVDYSLDHATTPSNFAWPNFPVGTADGGATEIQGDNVAWDQWDVLVDLAATWG